MKQEREIKDNKHYQANRLAFYIQLGCNLLFSQVWREGGVEETIKANFVQCGLKYQMLKGLPFG